MIIRTLLFFLVMYLLIKVIGRLFLPSGQKKKSRASVFYRTFQQFNQQYQNQQNQQSQKNRQSNSNSSNQQFEEIEEAEYEDITDDEKTSTKTSD